MTSRIHYPQTRPEFLVVSKMVLEWNGETLPSDSFIFATCTISTISTPLLPILRVDLNLGGLRKSGSRDIRITKEVDDFSFESDW